MLRCQLVELVCDAANVQGCCCVYRKRERIQDSGPVACVDKRHPFCQLVDIVGNKTCTRFSTLIDNENSKRRKLLLDTVRLNQAQHISYGSMMNSEQRSQI